MLVNSMTLTLTNKLLFTKKEAQNEKTSPSPERIALIERIHCCYTMASKQINEVEETVNDLRKHPGFKSYLILNNDGIVIKWGQEGSPMPYEKAVQSSHHVLDLYKKSKACIGDLFGPEEENQIECVRLRTDGYELIAAQEGKFTLVVTQEDEAKAVLKDQESGMEQNRSP